MENKEKGEYYFMFTVIFLVLAIATLQLCKIRRVMEENQETAKEAINQRVVKVVSRVVLGGENGVLVETENGVLEIIFYDEFSHLAKGEPPQYLLIKHSSGKPAYHPVNEIE